MSLRGVFGKRNQPDIKILRFLFISPTCKSHRVSYTMPPPLHTHTSAKQMPLFFSLLQYKPQPVLRQKHRNRRPKAVTSIHPIPAQSSDSKFNVVHIFFS